MAKPEVITERTLIRGVAVRWWSQYGRATAEDDKQRIGEQLDVLDGETASADDVVAIIGNQSWTTMPTCDGCGRENAPAIVRVGEEPHYDSRSAYLCESCVRAALAAFTPTGAARPRGA